jgi:hypothetical protein
VAQRIDVLEIKVGALERAYGQLASETGLGQIERLQRRVDAIEASCSASVPVARDRSVASATAPSLAAPASASAPPGASPVWRERFRWWCFRNANASWGDCSESKQECERWRAKLVTDHSKGLPCPPGMTEQQCVDIEARVDGLTDCEWQDRASCFAKHFKLAGDDDLACGPTIKICKARRADVIKNYADDQIVKSDCAARD